MKGDRKMLIELDLEGVRLEMPSSTPILILRESGGRRRMLPIAIGGSEASSIHFALEGIASERPLTHDLFVLLFGLTDVELESIVITEMVGTTYFAELRLRGSGGERVISCRPSDAVAIAVRVGAPMFATEAILDAVGRETAVTHVDTEEEILDEFRDFIDNIRPEDFQG